MLEKHIICDPVFEGEEGICSQKEDQKQKFLGNFTVTANVLDADSGLKGIYIETPDIRVRTNVKNRLHLEVTTDVGSESGFELAYRVVNRSDLDTNWEELPWEPIPLPENEDNAWRRWNEVDISPLLGGVSSGVIKSCAEDEWCHLFFVPAMAIKDLKARSQAEDALFIEYKIVAIPMYNMFTFSIKEYSLAINANYF